MFMHVNSMSWDNKYGEKKKILEVVKKKKKSTVGIHRRYRQSQVTVDIGTDRRHHLQQVNVDLFSLFFPSFLFLFFLSFSFLFSSLLFFSFSFFFFSFFFFSFLFFLFLFFTDDGAMVPTARPMGGGGVSHPHTPPPPLATALNVYIIHYNTTCETSSSV